MVWDVELSIYVTFALLSIYCKGLPKEKKKKFEKNQEFLFFSFLGIP